MEKLTHLDNVKDRSARRQRCRIGKSSPAAGARHRGASLFHRSIASRASQVCFSLRRRRRGGERRWRFRRSVINRAAQWHYCTVHTYIRTYAAHTRDRKRKRESAMLENHRCASARKDDALWRTGIISLQRYQEKKKKGKKEREIY